MRSDQLSRILSTIGASRAVRPGLEIDPGLIDKLLDRGGAVHNAEAYGVRGDDLSDNGTNLIKLRDLIAADPDTFHMIFFPPGVYQYTNNRWLWGLKKVWVLGYGAELMCTANKSFDRDNRLLKLRNPIEDYGDVDFPGDASAGWDVGFLIDTATRGDLTLTFTTTADAANFAVGDWVLVNGFDQQQGGFPPNLRFFEYHRVDAVNTIAGTITLEQPIQYFYSSTWWDSQTFPSTNKAGKPRVLNLNGVKDMAETLILQGLRMRENPNQPTHSFLSFDGTLDVLCIDLDCTECEAVTHAIGRSIVMEDCILDTKLEPDKLLDFCGFNRCKIGSDDGTVKSITNAVGVNHLVFEHCRFDYRSILVSPRRAEFRACLMRNVRGAATQTGLVGNNFSFYPINSFTIEGCDLTNSFTFDNEGTARSVLADAQPRSVVIDSVSGSDMVIAKAASKALNVLQNIDFGMMMIKDDGTKFGRVTDIVEHDASNIRIIGTWDSAPVASETWYWSQTRSIRIANNLYFGIVPYQAAVFSFLTFGGDEHVVGESVHVRVQNESMPWNSPGLHEWWLFGYIKSVWVHVYRAYSGSDTNPRLRVTLQAPAGGDPASIDLAQTGSRYVDSLQTLGAVGADTLTSANCMKFARTIRVQATHSTGTGLAGTIAQMPQATVILEVLPIQVPRL